MPDVYSLYLHVRSASACKTVDSFHRRKRLHTAFLVFPGLEIVRGRKAFSRRREAPPIYSDHLPIPRILFIFFHSPKLENVVANRERSFPFLLLFSVVMRADLSSGRKQILRTFRGRDHDIDVVFSDFFFSLTPWQRSACWCFSCFKLKEPEKSLVLPYPSLILVHSASLVAT